MRSQLEHFRGRLALESGECLTLAVASGKGGVGKSNLALNLAAALAQKGSRVLLVDGDAGLPDLNILLGARPERHWGHYVDGSCNLREIIDRDNHGVDYIHGFSGIPQESWMARDSLLHVVDGLKELSEDYDIQVIDVGAGLGDASLVFSTAVEKVLLLLNGELTSLADAYGTLKTIRKLNPRQKIEVVINDVESSAAAEQAFESLDSIAGRFLGISLERIAILPRDPTVVRAVAAQKPVIFFDPNSPYSVAVKKLAIRVRSGFSTETAGGTAA